MTKFYDLELNAPSDSPLGRVITYLENHPIEAELLANLTLSVRFLPFIIDRNDPNFEAVVHQSITECEAWARAIRAYAGLSAEECSSDIDKTLHSSEDS